MEDHATDELNVEVALAQGALGGLADRGEGGHQQLVQVCARRQLFAEHGGACAQCLVGQGLELRLHGVDRVNLAAILGDAAVVARAENPSGDAAQSEH